MVAKITETEYEKKILDLGKTLTSEKIGLQLAKEKIYSNDFKKSAFLYL